MVEQAVWRGETHNRSGPLRRVRGPIPIALMPDAFEREASSPDDRAGVVVALRQRVVGYVRSRVPVAEVDDLVQTVLCQAWAAAPTTEYAELSCWVLGIARHKIADFYRDRALQKRMERRAAMTLPGSYDGGIGAADWIRWAEAQVVGDEVARQTLRWMARESEGDKLSQIADEINVPPEVVRQRVSRLRRRMRRGYAAEFAAIGVRMIDVLGTVWAQRIDDRRDEPGARRCAGNAHERARRAVHPAGVLVTGGGEAHAVRVRGETPVRWHYGVSERRRVGCADG